MLPDWVALFVIDPGGTTGVGRGLWLGEDVAGGLRLADLMGKGLWETWEVAGPPVDQANEIMEEYTDWCYQLSVEAGLRGAVAVRVYMEDFQLRRRNVDLAPVKVMAGLETLAGGRLWRPHLVPAGAHKGAYGDQRLRDWGLWVKGSAHRRDAVRLLLYGLRDVAGSGTG